MRPSLQRIVAVLGVTQILAWGSTFYLPAVLARPIAADTSWPAEGILAGISIALLAAGFVAMPVGRMIERHGGRPVLMTSAVILATGLCVVALAPSLAVFLLG